MIEPPRAQDPAMLEIAQEIRGANDPRIMRIVAFMDTIIRRGSADLLIEPIRRRLVTLRPPRPLRFGRLMFWPLDLLIVPASRWLPGQHAIPRSALLPIAEHVRLRMGGAATSIEAEIAGRTTADIDLISRLGRSLWPEAAAAMMPEKAPPAAWELTGLGDATYQPLANVIAALLAEAATIDRLHMEAATGLLAPSREEIGGMLSRIGLECRTALPMLIATLLDRLPETAGLVSSAYAGSEAAATHAALEQATDLLLRQLDREDGIERRIAVGTLAETGAVVGKLVTLLAYLETQRPTPPRRERLRALRRRLDADCRARFASGLRAEILTPLKRLGLRPPTTDIMGLEASARGLRVLETEARLVGSGATYDLLLHDAAEAIRDDAMLDRLALADQLRLVEILSGPDAALALIDRRAEQQRQAAAGPLARRP